MLQRLIVIATLALFAALSDAAPVKLCVTHSQSLRPAAVAALEARGFEVDPTPVVQIPMPPVAELTLGSPEVAATIELIRRVSATLPPGSLLYLNWEYHDHYANAALNTPQQLFIKLVLASEIRRNGHRAGIYGPARIRANAMTAIGETSVENMRAVGRMFDFVLMPIYIGVHFEAGDPEHVRYMLNTQAGLREIRAAVPETCEVLLAVQFSVRPSGTTRSAMSAYEAATMGRVAAASGCGVVVWFEAREGNSDAIDRRAAELDTLADPFLRGWGWHRVDRNMDIGDPQGSE